MKKKALVIAGALIGFAVLARTLRAKVHGGDFRKKAFEHWREAFEQMPEDSPPKWMFRNITAIRQNTDQILKLLQQQRTEQEQPTGAILVP